MAKAIIDGTDDGEGMTFEPIMKVRTICWLSVLLGTMTLYAAEMLRVLECHDKVVEHGIKTLSCAKEANLLFGATNVDHFISNFESTARSPIWNSVAYFGGRYKLSLRVPITIDYEHCSLIGATNSMTVQINEVIKVELSTSGIAEATMKGQWRLNENEWKHLVDSKGDWSVVGVPILTNAPVNLFDEYERQMREPIRNRKEGFDTPIKQALKTLQDRSTSASPPSAENRSADALSELNCFNSVVLHGVDALIFPKQVESLFGSNRVDHFISKFGSKKQTPVWHSLTYFGGRYRLILRIPIAIDYERCRVRGGINSAEFQIDEFSKVDVSKGEVSGAKTKQSWTLGENEWKWLLKNNGNWSTVGVPLATNASAIEGFDKYVKRERARPIRERQEDFDRLIRKAVDALPYPKSNVDQR